MNRSQVTLEKIISLAKRRGFVYQAAEIYGGLNGVYDFGPLGALLKQHIRNAWMKSMLNQPEEVVLFDGSILGSPAIWEASGHLTNFHDPMVDCMKCKKRFRADEIDIEKGCPSCGAKNWTKAREFNLMFQTQLGAMTDQSSVAYLRPETAQSIFINFKNVLKSYRVKIPFGIAQIGKAFRNEITPKQFLFRMREFEQMELEFFCSPDQSDHFFKVWAERREKFYHNLGLTKEKLRLRSHEKDELAHYSKCCIDVEYEFPFGWKELEGIAHRSDYDLKQHATHSGKELSIFDEETQTSYIPHVVECSVGVDRLFLTILFDAYYEDKVEGQLRTCLKLHPSIAPVSAALLPLTKKLSEHVFPIYEKLKKAGYRIQFDEAGSIGKRYRRQDEIGTPVCFTFDFDSIQDQKVTARNRDTLEQERINIDTIDTYLDTKQIRKLYNWMNTKVHSPYATIWLGALFFIEAIFFIPVDPLLIIYCVETRKKSLYFAGIATLCSVLGGVVGYSIGALGWKSIGMRLVGWFISEKTFWHVVEKYKFYQHWAVLIAGFTPLPYKAVTISAGFCQLSLIPFIICSLISRGARFFLIGGIIRIWGAEMKIFIDRYLNQLVVLFVIVLIISMWVLSW
jgi:glycyl-tRNA synthetase